MDEIDAKLAGLHRRLEAKRALVRSKLEEAPELAAWLDQLRETFGPLKLTYLQVGDWTDGDPERIYELDDGTRGIAVVPTPYTRQLPPGRGKAAEMRKREGRS